MAPGPEESAADGVALELTGVRPGRAAAADSLGVSPMMASSGALAPRLARRLLYPPTRIRPVARVAAQPMGAAGDRNSRYSRWGDPMDVNGVSTSPVPPASARAGEGAREGTTAGDLFAKLLQRRTGDSADPLVTARVMMDESLFGDGPSIDVERPDARSEDRAGRDDARAAAADEDRDDAAEVDNGGERAERPDAPEDETAPAEAAPSDAQDEAGAETAAGADGTASQGQAEQAAAAAAASAAAAQAGAAMTAAAKGAHAGPAKGATATAFRSDATGGAKGQGPAATPGAGGGTAGAGVDGQAQARAAAARAATPGVEGGASQGGQGAAGTQAGSAGTAASAQAGTQTLATDAGARAAAQAERLAETVKPDTDLRVKVTVREGAAQATQAGARATAADGATANARATAGQGQAQAATSAEPTGAAALRQQALAALRQAQGESPTVPQDTARSTGPGAKPGIAEMNAAAAEARAQARAHLAQASGQGQPQPQAHAPVEGEAGAASPATRAAAGLAAATPTAGLERSGEARPTPAGGDRLGASASATARAGVSAGGPAQAGANGASGQGGGQTGSGASGGAMASASSTAPAVSGDAGQASGGSFADQLSRAGQGTAAEQTRSDPQTRKVVEQLRVTISKAANRGLDRVSIQLHPEKLGRVDVRLDFGTDGRVSAQVTVERPETLEMLQRDGRGLERALQDAGLKTDPGGVSFSLRGDAGGGAANAQERRGQAGRPGDPSSTGAGQDPGLDSADPDVLAMEAARARGGVNVKV